MIDLKDEKIVAYSRTVSGRKIESMYSYAYLKDGIYLALGCDSTIDGITEKLKAYRYENVQVWVESEIDFGKRNEGLGKAEKITEQEFKDYFNCLIPLRYVNSSYMEAFMFKEEITAGYFTFCVRLGDQYFSIKEHFTKSYIEIEKSIKKQLLEVTM